jgi:PleD family two-component response regulator
LSEAKSQILIVEDDLDLAEMLNSYFRVQGYEVQTAAWGKDAVRISTEMMPDLVVLDIRLPDIDGYEVCRQIRSNRMTSHLPIIFLTERRDRADKLIGLELGVVDYITKPFDIQELRLRVRNALSRAHQSPQVNPITNAPDESATDHQLAKLVEREGWAVLVMSIGGLDIFRELYGFIAADDVLRAIMLMIGNVVRDVDGENDYVGHYNREDLIVITAAEHAKTLAERIEARLAQSLPYFYPLKDRDAIASLPADERLRLEIGITQFDERKFDNVDKLKRFILRSQEKGRV